MTLAKEAAAGPPEVRPRLGKITLWLRSLSDEDRDAAQAVLADPSWSHADARALFARHGLDVSQQSLGTYRREHYGAR